MQYLYIFNAGHEAEIIYESPSYTPPKRIVSITNDLAMLPLWYIDKNSFVMTDSINIEDYYYYLKNIGFKLPKIISTKKGFDLFEFHLIPWGISKNFINKYSRIARGFGLNYVGDMYSENLKSINSRKFSIDILKILQSNSLLNYEISIPKIFIDFESLQEFIKLNKGDYLIKSPFSSSGIGLIWIMNNRMEQSERQIIKGILKKQGYIIIENVYNKIKDFAIEFYREETNKKFSKCGISLFETNSKGAYIGNYLKRQSLIKKELEEYIDYHELDAIIIELTEILNKECINTNLRCIGVDMMIAKGVNENYFIHPCIEVNPRFNMGFVSIIFFEKFVQHSKEGIFEIKYGKNKDLEEFIKEQNEKYPLVLNNGRIVSGFLHLTNIMPETSYIAYVKIEE